MAKKYEEPDKLALDMIQCKADGFGCHYGRWKALQENPLHKKKEIPDGWKVCPECGKAFQLGKYSKKKIYCEVECQKKAQRARDKGKYREYYRNYMKNRYAERKANEQ